MFLEFWLFIQATAAPFGTGVWIGPFNSRPGMKTRQAGDAALYGQAAAGARPFIGARCMEGFGWRVVELAREGCGDPIALNDMGLRAAFGADTCR